MNFSDLKTFFNNSSVDKIITENEINCNYINVISIYNRTHISFCDLEDINANYNGEVTENCAIEIQKMIEPSNDYFAKVISNKNHELLVEFVKTNKIPIVGDFQIGVGGTDTVGLDFDSFLNKFYNEFAIDIGGKKYYLYAKHKNAKDNIFSIVNAIEKYDVILSRRETVGACKKEDANDEIWAIKSRCSSYKKEDYIYQLRSLNIGFNNVSTAKATSEQNKIELSNQFDEGILGRWEKFTEEDYNISCEKIKQIDFIKYDKYTQEGNGVCAFSIPNGFSEKISLLNKYVNTLSSECVLNYYEKTEDLMPVKGVKLVFIKAENNCIRCRYEDDYIIKEQGFLRISNSGSEAIYKRRKEAVERIRNGNAAKKNILSLINGHSLSDKIKKKEYRVDEFKKEIQHAFHGRAINDSQRKAIEIAINTPDFAIIQGPPGCGKTSLINAIDECLAKIDSGSHRYGASLSTAYQRESTRNMIESKMINGVPVPFVSNIKEKKYIENNFLKYIDDISAKLKEKYPEYVCKIDNETATGIVSNYISRFDKDNSTIEAVNYLMKGLLNEGEEYFTESEINGLEEIVKLTEKKLYDILNKKYDNSIYYVKNLPSSEISFNDNGYETFLQAKVNLEILNVNFISDKMLVLENEYKKINPNFDLVKKVKTDIIFEIKNFERNNKDSTINEKTTELLKKIINRLNENVAQDSEKILLDYVATFINTPIKVRQALEPWITSIAATHQIAGDSKAIPQPNNASLVEFENVLIDEAARSCPPDLLIPITCAKNRIIMVGDHKQLPQFVNEEVLEKVDLQSNDKEEMKKVSMFEYLIGTTKKLEENDPHHSRFVALDSQYRMPKILGDFISDAFYPEIKIKSPRGNPRDDIGFVQTLPYISNKCMVWCDVPYGENKRAENKSQYNEEEAKVVAKMVRDFLYDANNKDLTIGVISQYKEQVNKIKERLSKDNIILYENDKPICNSQYVDRLKIDTVDAFQGLECDIIILSMVISKPERKFDKNVFTGHMQDEKRWCVALSRQKRCLIIVGNGSGMLNSDIAREEMKAVTMFYEKCKNGGEYIDYIESKNII